VIDVAVLVVTTVWTGDARLSLGSIDGRSDLAKIRFDCLHVLAHPADDVRVAERVIGTGTVQRNIVCDACCVAGGRLVTVIADIDLLVRRGGQRDRPRA
jgi:hypothetical protein